MAGVDVGINHAAQGESRPAEDARRRMQSPLPAPPVHAPAEDQEMEQDRQVDRPGQRQAEKNDIQRIQYGGLESAEEGFTRIGVGIPERQMPCAQAGRGEGPPGNDLGGEVAEDRAENQAGGQKEDHDRRHDQEQDDNRQFRTRDALHAGISPILPQARRRSR